MKYEKCKVVMLPVPKAIYGPVEPGRFINHISVHEGRFSDTYSYEKYMDGIRVPYPQHLYICSNEKIKAGDWFINKDGLWQCSGIIPTGLSPLKVIATTNELENCSLPNPSGQMYLPRPSKEFIEKYCNLGGIDEVMVEYEKIKDCPAHGNKCRLACGFYSRGFTLTLKVAPDNTITIRAVKTVFTLEDMQAAYAEGLDGRPFDSFISKL